MFMIFCYNAFMNIFDSRILISLYTNNKQNQRDIAKSLNISLGLVNKSIQNLKQKKFLNKDNSLTEFSITQIKKNSPHNAIILAAGIGMRMVPINTETPKGLLEINGEPLIERLIIQLQQVGIFDITIVVGFMKDYYEYLIDKFNVTLVVNTDYAAKNNLHSLALVQNRINNSYIIPCDIWCKKNPFNMYELNSWYMILDNNTKSSVRVNTKMEIIKTSPSEFGNSMIGVAYINNVDSSFLSQRLFEYDLSETYANSFWEDAAFENKKMIFDAKLISSDQAIEINTYEQLRELDSNSCHLKSDALDIICNALNVSNNDIKNINILKKGMTNRSFIFTVKNERYIMRIPGAGTDFLINREQEAHVYNAIKDYNVCDTLFYINPKNGYKISKYIENSRVCAPFDLHDLKKCMKKLRSFHNLNLKVNHTFDIFGQIDFYESLWNGESSCFRDYAVTKEHIFSLKPFVEATRTQWCLTHIDAVPDNFLFSSNEQDVQLIDWEYAGMQDPHVDIAMFCIYSLYDSRELVDRLIDCYFTEGCSDAVRAKIYCYIAICGLLWSNWCEYKRQLGVEFGEYSLRQYRFAKDYYKIAKAEIEKLGGNDGGKNA